MTEPEAIKHSKEMAILRAEFQRIWSDQSHSISQFSNLKAAGRAQDIAWKVFLAAKGLR